MAVFVYIVDRKRDWDIFFSFFIFSRASLRFYCQDYIKGLNKSRFIFNGGITVYYQSA